MLRRLAAAGLATLVVAGPAAVAQEGTGIGIRLLEAPASRADDPRAQSYIIDHVSPGTSFERTLEVVNDTGRDAEVGLYSSAADIRDGTFVGAARGSQNEVTRWASVQPPSLTLQQGGRGSFTVSFDVPSDARPGEYYGVVYAELPPRPEATGPRVASRAGVRVYLSVGSSGEPMSDFTVQSLTAERDDSGTPVVRALVKNTGGRALDMRGELELRDGPGGTSAGPFPAQVGTTIPPGGSAPVAVSLARDTPAGPWRARMTMRSGLLERAAEATITFPEGSGEKAEPVAAEEIPLDATNPWVFAAGALIGLLALLLLLLALLKRRSRRKKDDEEPELATAAAG